MPVPLTPPQLQLLHVQSPRSPWWFPSRSPRSRTSRSTTAKRNVAPSGSRSGQSCSASDHSDKMKLAKLPIPTPSGRCRSPIVPSIPAASQGARSFGSIPSLSLKNANSTDRTNLHRLTICSLILGISNGVWYSVRSFMMRHDQCFRRVMHLQGKWQSDDLWVPKPLCPCLHCDLIG